MMQTTSFHSLYRPTSEILGEGISGLVRVFIHIPSGSQVAVKTLQLSDISPARKSMLLQEVSIFRTLSHPNIVKLHEVFEEEGKIFLIMEICRGGELYDRLAVKEYYDEHTARNITAQMLNAVDYLHKKGIVHRDLKLEHWLLRSPPSEEAEQIALIDFGFSTILHPSIPLTATLGSIHYVAPEVLAGRYGLECDTWSLGVIVYMLLSGTAPFDGESEEEIMEKIKTGRYTAMSGPRWTRLSEKAKDFVCQLLVVDVDQRMTAKEGLQHPWLSGEEVDVMQISRSVVNMLQLEGSQVGAVKAAIGLLRQANSKKVNDHLRMRLGAEISAEELVEMLEEGFSNEERIAKFLTLARGKKFSVKTLLEYTETADSAKSTRITRVHSTPSKVTEIFFRPRWYGGVLRGFYARQAVSNLVLGLVHGWSGFARKARSLGLTRVLSLGELGALFLLPNPKFHDDLDGLSDLFPCRGARFVVWWVAPTFEQPLRLWHDEGGDSPPISLGEPGDFGFSGERKPDDYLHCYRDLRGRRSLALLKGFSELSENFLRSTFGSVVVSRGFHFPVRTQYSTLHMQIRVNSGSVVGADGRGVALEDVTRKLQEDPEVFWRDEEAMRFRVTDNIKANLIAAAIGAVEAAEVGNTTEGE